MVVDSDGRAGVKFSEAEKSTLATKSESKPASQTQTLVQGPLGRDVKKIVEGGRVFVDLRDRTLDIMQPASQPQTLVQQPLVRNVKKIVEGGRMVVEYADNTPDILPAIKDVYYEQFLMSYRAEVDAQFDAMKTEINDMKTKMQTEIDDIKIKMQNNVNATQTRIKAMNDTMETKIDAWKTELAALKAKVNEMEEKLTANGTDKQVPNVPAVVEDYRKRILVLEAYLRDRY